MLHRARRSVLIADKNHTARQSAVAAFEAGGYAAAECESVADAVSRLEGYPYDGLVVDVRLADGDGLDVLDVALSRYPHMRAVVTAEFGSLHHAVRALKRGAIDFLVKPCSAEQLVSAIGATQPAEQAQPQPPVARRPQPQPRPASMLASGRRIIGESPAIVRLLETLARVAPMQSTVLDQGRDGHGQGACRAGASRDQLTSRPAVRRVQLRGGPRGTCRGGALRPREGRLHRRRAVARGPIRGRRQGHALHRRGVVDVTVAAEQAPARASGAGNRARGHLHAGQGQHAGHCRDERGPARHGARRRVPRGSLLPLERARRGAAAAPHAQVRHPAARGAFCRGGLRDQRAGAEDA